MIDHELVELIAQRTAELVAGRQPARLVDAATIAEQLCVPTSWVLAQARADRIPHRKLGRYPRFDPDEVNRWASTRHAHGPSVARRSAP